MKKHTGYVDNLTKYKIDFDANEVFKEMVYPCLTKEDFWNKLMTTCPKAVTSFCNWIDEYKSATLWNDLFNGAIADTYGGRTEAPKFHDLPFPMQYGILCQYFNDLIAGGYVSNRFKCPTYSLNLTETVDGIIMSFIEHQNICSLTAGCQWPK
ncbi:MAG: hypothetical protein ACHQIM_22720 [Sphingobacteriales bacterium]